MMKYPLALLSVVLTLDNHYLITVTNPMNPNRKYRSGEVKIDVEVIQGAHCGGGGSLT